MRSNFVQNGSYSSLCFKKKRRLRGLFQMGLDTFAELFKSRTGLFSHNEGVVIEVTQELGELSGRKWLDEITHFPQELDHPFFLALPGKCDIG